MKIIRRSVSALRPPGPFATATEALNAGVAERSSYYDATNAVRVVPFWQGIAALSPVAAFDFSDTFKVLNAAGNSASTGEAVATINDKFGGAHTLTQATTASRWIKTATGIRPPNYGSANLGLQINGLSLNWRSFSMVLLVDRNTVTTLEQLHAGCLLSNDPYTTIELNVAGAAGGYLRGPTRYGITPIHNSNAGMFIAAGGADNLITYNPLKSVTHTASDAVTSTINTILARVSAGAVTAPYGKPLRGIVFFDRKLTPSEASGLFARYSGLSGRQWFFLGDSITFGYTASAASNSYVGLVSAELGIEAAINGAYPGTASGTGSWTEWENSHNGPNDVFSYFIGANDLVNAGNLATLKSNVATMFANALSKGWTKRVAFTVLPRTGGVSDPARFETDRQGFNTWLRAQTFYEALADVGAHPVIGAPGASTNLTYYSDGTHPTNAGHRIIADVVKAAHAAAGW